MPTFSESAGDPRGRRSARRERLGDVAGSAPTRGGDDGSPPVSTVATRAPALGADWRIVEVRSPDGAQPSDGIDGEQLLARPAAPASSDALARIRVGGCGRASSSGLGGRSSRTSRSRATDPLRLRAAALAARRPTRTCTPPSRAAPRCRAPAGRSRPSWSPGSSPRGVAMTPITLHTGVSSLGARRGARTPSATASGRDGAPRERDPRPRRTRRRGRHHGRPGARERSSDRRGRCAPPTAGPICVITPERGVHAGRRSAHRLARARGVTPADARGGRRPASCSSGATTPRSRTATGGTSSATGTSSSRRRSRDAKSLCRGRRGGAVRNRELGEDPRHMDARGLLADDQLGRDLPVRSFPRRQAQKTSSSRAVNSNGATSLAVSLTPAGCTPRSRRIRRASSSSCSSNGRAPRSRAHAYAPRSSCSAVDRDAPPAASRASARRQAA